MTNYTITNEAIDEAAEAIRVGIDRRSIWDLAKAALEAGAPFIRAQALEDAADDMELPGSDATGYYSGNEHYGYAQAELHAETWLRSRAAREVMS